MLKSRSSAALRWIQGAGFAVVGALSLLACSSPSDGSSESTDSASTSAAREGQSCATRHCAAGLTCVPAATGTKKTCQVVVEAPVIASFFSTHSATGQEPVIDAIGRAHSTIRMMMFHLTTTAVVDALVAAAGRGVDIQIILDAGNLASHTPAAITKALADAGIKVVASSPAFQITHVKSLVIDGTTALVMSLNLTNKFTETRDYAVVTHDPGVIAEFMSVFEGDLENAKNGTGGTPVLTDAHLAWSPVNSESRLVAFIDAAAKDLVVTTENLGDAAIMDALERASARGVTVRVIAPLCDDNVNPLYDLPSLAQLAKAGVSARAMPSPASATQPYMHAKMMIADGARAYIGSINLSTNSTQRARELGIFFSDAAAIHGIAQDFEQDWSVAVTPPPASTVSCPAAG
jgi:cardiolipin synthase